MKCKQFDLTIDMYVAFSPSLHFRDFIRVYGLR